MMHWLERLRTQSHHGLKDGMIVVEHTPIGRHQAMLYRPSEKGITLTISEDRESYRYLDGRFHRLESGEQYTVASRHKTAQFT